MADDAGPGKPLADLGVVRAALLQLKRDREGVPMFLVLEDMAADGPPAAAPGPAPDGPVLAALAEHYRHRMFPESAEPAEQDIAAILEVLAAAHFGGAGR